MRELITFLPLLDTLLAVAGLLVSLLDVRLRRPAPARTCCLPDDRAPGAAADPRRPPPRVPARRRLPRPPARRPGAPRRPGGGLRRRHPGGAAGPRRGGAGARDTATACATACRLTVTVC